uniref:Laminin subunit alpha 3 n=1 Tax=Gadus morhua TaxID=8049 RepID=A0A8C4YYG1_GADMO
MARRMEVYLLFFILFTSFCRHANGQVSLNEITGFSLSPPYFNLAQGSDISATATCGQDDSGSPRSDLYCKLVGGHNTGFNVQNIQGQFCDHCNSNEPNKAHPVTNAIDGTERWWQSPPLSRGPKYNQVNITLDLGQLYHVAYILIKFANSPRPDLWVLERSVDNGKTYRPWQYFAHSKHECVDEFGKQPNRRVEHDGDQICTTEYSKIPPLENGEIVVSLINGRPGSSNFTYSPVLRDFTKATNIRLRFLRTSTLLGHLISKAQRDPTVTRRYYYSIKDISVGGRCVCHGHAQECGVRGQANSNRRHCECTHNTCGESCDRCCPGFNQRAWRAATADSPNASCQCFSHAFDCYYDPEVERRGASLDSSGGYGGGGVCIGCQHNTAGVNCEKCAEGFYRPHHERPESGCIPCSCDPSITAGCEMGSGRCICKPGISGHNCDLCADGYYGYPQCVHTTAPTPPIPTPYPTPPQTCCSVLSPPNVCDASGRCLCRQGVEGPYCERCRPGHHSFPGCQGLECRCDGAGAADPPACDPTGRCLCLGNYAGERCDRCAQGYYGYPDCAGDPTFQGPNDGLSFLFLPWQGPCRCLANVEGTFCDRCKPLYWKLTMDNPEGCTGRRPSGQCHCKPHTCGPSCDTCKEGFYLLQKRNYFGCQGCECDVGGATGMACDFGSGQCRCRKNIVGRTCSLPAPSHYFPSLHQLKYEVEDGVTPNSRPVRFGFEPRVFPGFSWRGYAVLSPAQSDVRVKVHVEGREARESWYRLVLRYSNPSGSSVTGTVEATGIRAQSQEVVFPAGPGPAFLTVPGDGFAQPFVLTPGNWFIHIRAQGVLLDYLVLLPRDFYQAPLLQDKITQPCNYSASPDGDTSCLLYKHVGMDGFSWVLGSQGRLSSRGGRRRRQARVRRLSPEHPPMATLSGRQVAVAVGGNSRVTFLQLEHRNEILLHASSANFLLVGHPVYAVPAEDFSMDYVQPRVLCVSVHGRFTDDRYVWSQSDCRSSPCSMNEPSLKLDFKIISLQSRMEQISPKYPIIPGPNGLFIHVNFRPRVPVPGRYVVVLHYRQPEHPSFPVGVLVEAGRAWNGSVDASFCPSVSGCREVVVASNRIALEFEGGREPTITVKIPPGKTLTLDYVLVVADDSYSPDLLREKPLNKSAEFITRCRGEGFHIDPRTSSEFCRSSAHSLVAAYNDGALPCDCDESGTTLPACDPDGGQCTCRPNVIGRRCSKCATGYYGFPYCRPCGCGRRLCDEVTGRCICPPQTVKPSCDVCDSQTFSFHPLLGCEGCDCSPTGVRPSGGLECDNVTGQCPCKPRIGGRQCNRCAAGYHGYPDCRPCDCNQSGVTPDVCHPDTGRCLCKRNVGGARCDVCKGASFHFEPSNPEGCTRCFCFGATDQCQSSGKHRGKFMDMRDWRLEKPDQNEVASTLNPASNTVVADVQELSPVTQVLHWVAPPSYLGDRVLSYGGFLTFQSKSFGVPAEGMKLMDRSPDIILSGQGMTLVHQGTDPPTPDRLHHGRVQLVEGLWRHALTNRPVSREELMMVLADLEGLRIRGLYFTQSQRLSLGEVGLETASDRGPGAPAGSVEQCVCPPEYAGDSCQKCSPGYYRDGSGLYLGRCVRCECNGLSSQCEDKTGRCQNCDSDAAGPRCELCKEGYYGNPALRSCRVCPCPFNVASNSFALGCKEGPGGFQCVCKEGYAGERCEKCAPGFYGDPMMAGGSCRPCNCHGNGNSCDPSTGGTSQEWINAELMNSDGGDSQSPDLSRQLDEAQRLVKEMEKRNFNPQKAAAEKEREEARKCEKICLVHHAFPRDNPIINNNNCCSLHALRCRACLHTPLPQHVVLIVSLNQSQEYEQLAAQLDGAKRDLTQKVNEISQAANKEDLVIRAEEHADKLSKMAMDLQNAVGNASGRTDVRDAIDAINAYKNITDAINAAEAAANEAKAAADKALKVHDIGDMIDEAKRKAARASTTTANTQDRLNNIKDELDKIKVTPGDSNINDLMDEVDQSVRDLLNQIPTLEDKLSEMENLSSQFLPVSNITENIKKIKELIEQARDAANRVNEVPMKFMGDGYVELHTPTDLDDLKAYTELSLSLQRPLSGRGDGKRRRRQVSDDPSDMFVMYLGNRNSTGDFIGMAVRQHELYFIYRLHGRAYEIKTGTVSRSLSNPAIFDKVVLQRIYQDAQVTYTEAHTSREPKPAVISTKQGDLLENLLSLNPSDVVFYVGGFPADFTPPASLNYPMYRGCIEFSSFNERFFSLYNFKEAVKINREIPCKRSVFSVFNILYLRFSRKPSNLLPPYRNNITIPAIKGCIRNIKTNKESPVYLETVGVSRGCRLDLLVRNLVSQSIPYRIIRHACMCSHAHAHTRKNTRTHAQTHTHRHTHTGTHTHGHTCTYIHTHTHNHRTIRLGPVMFCPCRTSTHTNMHTHTFTQTDTHTCMQSHTHKQTQAHTHTNTELIVWDPLFLAHRPHFSLEVRTRSPDGLLFFAATRRGNSHMAVYMSKGRIRFSVGKNKEIFNREKYNDGKWHSVMFSLEKKKFRLIVDGIRAQDGQLTSNEVASLELLSPLYLGSAPESLHQYLKVKHTHSVLGCLRNFQMNGRAMLQPTTNHGAGPCFDGPLQSGAYFPGSNCIFMASDDFVVGEDFELLFDIRPRNLTGVLLHVGNFSRAKHGASEGHHLSLYMLKGEVIAQVNNGAGEFSVSVMPKTALCDGTFHKISGKLPVNGFITTHGHQKGHRIDVL